MGVGVLYVSASDEWMFREGQELHGGVLRKAASRMVWSSTEATSTVSVSNAI